MDNGEVAAACEILAAGLERTWEFADSGEPWAGDLAASYRHALLELSILSSRSRRIPMRPVRR